MLNVPTQGTIDLSRLPHGSPFLRSSGAILPFVILLLTSGCSQSTKPRTCPPYYARGSVDISPTWSPDAKFIAYDRGVHNAPDTTGVYVISSAGGTPTLLTAMLFSTTPELAWSPDGTRIAFYAGDIWTVTVPDAALRRWTFNAPYAVHPAWSPDGRYLAYVVNARDPARPDSASGLHMIDTRDGSQRALLHNGVATTCERVAWSPLGHTIAFAGYSAGKSTTDIYTVAVDGTQFHRLTDVNGTASDPQWNSDSSLILFDFAPAPCIPSLSTDRTTLSIHSDGTGLRRWPVNLGDPRVTFAFPFVLSPDGQRVAFVGLDVTKRIGVIWTKGLDGSGPRQITQP